MLTSDSSTAQEYSGRLNPSRRGVLTRAIWRDAAAVALLLGLALAMLGRQIVFGGSLDDGDIVLQSIPVYSWYAEALRQGQLPIWSTEILGGFPLALGQYAFFYPPDMVLFRLLDAPRAFHLSLALHLALAGICTYWYCRVLGLGRLPALLAAVAFQMGNEVLSWPANGFITRTAFALPALLAITELLFRGRSRYWLLIPVVVAAALLGGYAQILLFALAATALYALAAAWAGWKGGDRDSSIKALMLLSAGAALGFGIAAVRVVPTLALTALSTRSSGMAFDRSTVDSIDPWSLLVGYLLPSVLDLAADRPTRPDYVGGPVLFLAMLAVAAMRRNRVPVFHAAMAGVTAVLSLGSFTPLYGLLLQLPFFSFFRGPNRLSLVAALAISVLAAYALEWRVAEGLPRLRWRYRAVGATAVAGGLLLVAGIVLSLMFQFGRDPLSDGLRSLMVNRGWDALNLLRPRVGLAALGLVALPVLCVAVARGRLSHAAVAGSALVLTVATLFAMGWLQNRWMPPAQLYQAPALVDTLKADPDRYRVFAWAPHVMLFNLKQHFSQALGVPPPSDFEESYSRQFVPPNLGMMFGVSTQDGYEVLQTRRQALVSTYLGAERRERGVFSDGSQVSDEAMTRQLPERIRFLAAMNVRYLINAFPVANEGLALVKEVPLRIYPDRPDTTSVYLYRVEGALPRAFVVPETRLIAGERAVLEALSSGAVDLAETVILEEQAPSLSAPALSRAGSTVEISDYRGERVELKVRSDGAGFLVLMDFLLPGWSASVDGVPASVFAANFAGRAVPIPGAGDHTVIFTYETPLLREGLL